MDEQVELAQGELRPPRPAAHPAGGEVDREGPTTIGGSRSVAHGSARRSTASTRATSSRGRERLDDVVVGAELQADDPVGLLALRGQQDHRAAAVAAARRRRMTSNPSMPGQHDVEHHQVGALLGGAVERVDAVAATRVS